MVKEREAFSANSFLYPSLLQNREGLCKTGVTYLPVSSGKFTYPRRLYLDSLSLLAGSFILGKPTKQWR